MEEIIKQNDKPLKGKNYGSIAHLPNSRMGPADHSCHEGQARIACEKTRDKHDLVIVQEKLDGSNVGVAKVNGELIALTRAGYRAITSPYEQHHMFDDWVKNNAKRFDAVLNEGERLVGEWLVCAHGTRYDLPHEPFVAFDIMEGKKRLNYLAFAGRVVQEFMVPELLHINTEACSIEKAMDLLGDYGNHGAIDKVEGCMWRIERNGEVDFLCKYVRPDKVDGLYLDAKGENKVAVWNTWR